MKHPLKHPRVVRGLATAWLLLVIVGSLQPARPSLAGYSNLHLGIHWVAFVGAAFLLLLASSSRRQEIRAVIASCLLGLTLEYLQHLLYRIDIEWSDVRNDWLAVFASYLLYRLAGIDRTADAS